MDLTAAREIAQEFIGIQPNESNAAYHTGPGTSFSGFKEFIRYPKAYPAYLVSERKSTPSQDLGTWAHMATLEPELFAKTCVRIDGPMNRNPWKKQADEAKEAGLEPIGADTYDAVIGMRDSMLGHKVAGALLAGSQREVSCYAQDPATGLLIKCRPDIMREDILTLGDLKTIDDVRKCRPQIRRMKYGLQSAWYLRILSLLTGKPWRNMVHVFVETKAPHGVKCIALGDETLLRWDRVIEANMGKLAECLTRDIWPGPADDGVEKVEQEYYEFEDEEDVA